MYSFKVFGIFVSQQVVSGLYTVLESNISEELLEVGEWYIFTNIGREADFSNVGRNELDLYFQATGTTPNSWGSSIKAVLSKISNPLIEINPFYEANGITRELIENTKFERDKFNGTILVKGSDYDMFYIYLNEAPQNYSHKFEFRVYKDNTQIYTANLLMNGQFNTIEKLCSFNIETLDQYTKIIANRDVKYDIIKGVTPIVSCNVETNFSTLVFKRGGVFSGENIGYTKWFEDTFSGVVYTFWAREEKLFANIEADELIQNHNDGWYLLTDNNNGTKTLMRDWSANIEYPVISDMTDFEEYTLNNALSDWQSYFDDPQINEILLFPDNPTGLDIDFIKGQFLFYFDGGLTNSYWALDYNKYYGTQQILYTRLRRLDDTIEWLVSQMDNSIQFDTNSFDYFSINEDLANLLIAGVTDIILNPTNSAQQDSPSTKGLLSFGAIMDLFAGHPFHLYWYLENISGTYYFRLKHISELITLGASQIDFTNLQNKNWCIDKGSFAYKSDKFFGKIILTNTSGSVDFANQIIDTSLVDIKNNYEKNIDTFYFDVWDIQNNKSKYPNLSVEQFVILSTQFSEVEYMSIAQNVSFDLFTFTELTKSIFCQANALTQGIAKTNGFHIEPNIKYLITFTNVEITGLAEFKIYFGKAPFYAAASDIVVLEDGVLSYEITTTEANDVSLIFLREPDAVLSTLVCDGISIKIQTLDCRKSNGKITGLPSMNSDLSIASVLDNHGKYEFPSTPVIINGVSTEVEVDKLKEQEVILVPIFDQNDIDFRKYVTTNLGTECEVESLTINFNEDFAQIKVKL